jgi:hypothetical protein
MPSAYVKKVLGKNIGPKYEKITGGRLEKSAYSGA